MMDKVRDKMIEFRIEEEEDYIRVKNIIQKVMMKEDYEYRIKEEKEKISDTYKIYILNIENEKNKNRIERIRAKDWASMIIVTTKKKELVPDLLKRGWLLVDVILKEKEYEYLLERAIRISIQNYKQRPNMLKYEYKNSLYNIPIREIKYIEKRKEEKKCRIVTTNGEYEIAKSIMELEQELKQRMIKTSRSCLINKDQILSYHKRENKITFQDKTTYTNISRNQKKEIIDSLRKVE